MLRRHVKDLRIPMVCCAAWWHLYIHQAPAGRFSGMRISWFDLWLVAPTWHSLSLFVVLTMVLTALGCSRPARGLDEWASELPSGGAHAWSVTNHHSAAAVVQLHSHRAHCSPIRNLQDR